MSFVFHFPSEQPDVPAAKQFLTSEGIIRKQGEQHRTVCDYISSCNDELQRNPTDGKELNKPNVHRALELCVLTIPSFGHARTCSEMVLEIAHRSFKQWLEKNHNASAHIMGEERTLLRDWLGRLFKLYKQWESGSGDTRERAEVGLLRALLGREASLLDRSKEQTNVLLREFRHDLVKLFEDPVLDEMVVTGHVNEDSTGSYHWEMFNAESERDEEHRSLRRGRDLLHDLYCFDTDEEAVIVQYRTVRYVTSKGDGERRMYGHHTVTRGTAISAVTKQGGLSSVVQPAEDGDVEAELHFYVVYRLFAVRDDNWAVVRHLRKVNNGYTARGSPLTGLEMNSRVRRVGLGHNCTSACVVNRAARTVQHTEMVLQGGYYTVLSRGEGYPVHLG